MYARAREGEALRPAPVAVVTHVLKNLQLLAITRALGADYADAR